MHQNLGFGSKCRDRDRGVQYDTAERIAVSVQMRREMISEELRVLYVAMTRAKEKLILTAATGSLRNSLKNGRCWHHSMSCRSTPWARCARRLRGF